MTGAVNNYISTFYRHLGSPNYSSITPVLSVDANGVIGLTDPAIVVKAVIAANIAGAFEAITTVGNSTDDVAKSTSGNLPGVGYLYAYNLTGDNWDRVRISDTGRVLVDGSGAAASNTPYTNTGVTVTNASQQFLAANASRKYLLIQNKDATGTIYVNFGAAATVANGVRLTPGAVYEMTGMPPNNSINIIGDIASNANVVLVEG